MTYYIQTLILRWHLWRERSHEVHCGQCEHWWQRDRPFGSAPVRWRDRIRR